MNQDSILNYYKEILEKVSFEEELFKKEYSKALNHIHPNNHFELQEWLRVKGLYNMVVTSESMFDVGDYSFES